MRKTIPTLLLLASALLALLPTAAAIPPTPTVCDLEQFLCNEYVIPEHEHVTTNPDGSHTVTYDECSINGWCSWPSRSVTIPAPASLVPSTCFAYNPDALTNACVQTTGGSVSAPVGVGLATENVCVVGPECVSAPVPSVTSGPTTEPAPSGYVEITALCPTPCRVTL